MNRFAVCVAPLVACFYASALTYGATGSGANVIDNDHFAGTGVLRVMKPCGTFIFLR
ncbi:MAG: hypothetical protein IJP66_02040 [Kiritimatiellae bacterium]|nr:hypothetical protein [Kiritimatiellia bacterium]